MASSSTLCPYCEKHTHLTPVWGRVFQSATRLRFAATCDNCSRLVVAEGGGRELTGNSGINDTTEMGRIGPAISRCSELSWLPTAAEAPDVPDVPESIERAAKEAYRDATIGNHMSAILMARTVIEATAKANGIKNGDLSKKINEMRDKGLIRPAIADRAHEVRYFGNDMAHGDIEDVPEEIDAEEVLALMGQVLSEVFQGPALMRRLRARRTGETEQSEV